MKKLRQIIALILLLGVVPGITWFFLKGGLDYRLNAMEELKTDARINLPDQFKLIDSNAVVLIAVEFNNKEVEDILLAVRKHYMDADSQLVICNIGIKDQIDEKPQSNIINFSSPVLINELRLVDAHADMYLLNQKGELRYSYKSAEKEDLAKLIKHIAFVLPPREKKEIKFERENEK